PTLSEWGLLLLSVLAGLTGAWRMKTHAPRRPRRPRF
ncbi:MAG: IPTL-CTERM sorting domain-containing protein, partial [Comamonadaceae bacterium]